MVTGFAPRAIAIALMGGLAGMSMWATTAPAAAQSRQEAAGGRTVLFQDGFEDVQSLSDLFRRDANRWSNFQIVKSANRITLQSETVHGGRQALRFDAIPSDSEVSKANVERGRLSLAEGQRVRISAWFFLPPRQNLDNLFLIDVECRSCWPEGTHRNNPSPGIRLMLKDREGQPVVERGKLGRLPTLRQTQGTKLGFPTNRWVHLEWILDLSTGQDGKTEILLDGKRALSARGITMPSPEVFRQSGVELKQPVVLERVQLGITANSTPGPIVLYVDDVTITAEPIPQ